MHHKSMESQEVYTQPTIATVTETLNGATTALDSGLKISPNTTMGDYYFKDFFKEEYKEKRKYIRGKINGKI